MAKNYFSGVSVRAKSSCILNEEKQYLVRNSFTSRFQNLLFVLLLYLLSVPGFSQITIGSSTLTQVYPLGNVLGYERSASLYLSTEATSGTISKLAWYSNSGNAAARPLKIYLKTTSSSTFSASTWDSQISSATEVYSGIVVPTVGWNTIVLQLPFTYNISDGNLVVLVEANAGGSGLGSSSNAAVRYSNSANRHMFYRGNSTAPSGNGSINAARPNIQISFASAAVPPSCAVNLQPANSAPSVALNPTLTWGAGEGQPGSYDLYFGTTSNPSFIGNQTSTSYSPSLLQPFTQYFYKVVPRNGSGPAISCSVQSFTTSDQIQYCTSTPLSNDNLGITEVKLTQTIFSHSDVTYTNFTNPVDITQGSSTNLKITFNTGISYDTNVWIDFDKNGEFSSAELVFHGNSATAAPTVLDASFFLPQAVTLGEYKMRIGSADTGQAIPNPCYSGPFGVTIDMIVNVVVAAPMPPACPTNLLPVNGTSNVPLNPTLTWTSSTGNPSSYDIYFGTNSDPAFAVNVPASVNSFTPSAPLSATGIYYWKVVGKNIHGESIGCDTQLFLTGSEMQYCTPTYNNPCTAGDTIQNFTINSLNNTASGCNGNLNNYIKYPASGTTTTSLGQGMSYNASVKIGSHSANVGIYIDFNKNGQFDSSEYFGSTSLIPANGTRVITVVIPQNADLGTYRMRVRSISSFAFANVDACANASNGETEDYTIDVIECNASVWFADTDNDGYGDDNSTIISCDQPSGYVGVGGDCDDTDGTIYRSGSFYIDNDGDGFDSGTATICYGVSIPQGYNITTLGADCDDNLILYADSDEDGYGSFQISGCGVSNSSDCDDNDSLVFQTQMLYVDADGDGFHSSVEFVCIGSSIPTGYSIATLGEDCDDSQFLYADSDGDGYGAGEPVSCGVSNNSDCDDTDVLIFQTQVLYIDIDGDGYHNGLVTICTGDTIPSGYSATSLGEDCDDNLLLYADNDGDGFGAGEPVGCGLSNNTDCNDEDALVYQMQTIFIDADGDGFDNGTISICYGDSVPTGYSLITMGTDCDDTQILYADLDGDGYGSGEPAPCGVNNNTDCDDTNPLVYQKQLLYVDLDGDGFHGGTEEICFGADIPAGYSFTSLGADCDDNQLFYADNDGDGYGSNILTGCGVGNNTDCDDSDGNVHQSILLYIDSDNDGYHGGILTLCVGETIPNGYSLATLGEDCDDQNPNVYRNDFVFIDADGDGYDGGSVAICFGDTTPAGYILESLGADCNDQDASVFHGAVLFADADGDGYHNGSQYFCYGSTIPNGYLETSLGFDCDDANASINPGAVEILYNGFDENCDGELDEGFQRTTSVKVNQCDSTLSFIYTPVHIYDDSMASSYKFRIRNIATNNIEYLITTNTWFQFSVLQNYSYGASYSVDVELQIQGVWLGYYGPSCMVSLPGLEGEFAPSIRSCGSTLAKIYSPIYANTITSVSSYKFRVINLTHPGSEYEVQEIERPTSFFNLTMLPSYEYGTTYSIQVAVKTTGNYTPFGVACTISTPAWSTLPLSIRQCGETYTSIYKGINAGVIPNVSGYRFRFTNIDTNESEIISQVLSYTSLSKLTTYVAGSTYSVEVAVKTTEDYGPYGAPCTINAPAAKSSNGITVKSANLKVKPYPNPFSETFSLDFSEANAEAVEIRVYDMIGKLLEVRSFQPSDVSSQRLGSVLPTGVYNLIITQGDQVKAFKVIKR